MAKPLPAPLQSISFDRAHNFRYAFYAATPLTVGPDGQVKEGDEKTKEKDKEKAKEKAKEDFLSDAFRAWNNAKAVVEPLIMAAAKRMEAQEHALCAQGLEARCVTHQTATRLLAGLGYKNGAEIGLALHPLYGIPYLPGSSLKGLVRAWARHSGADEATRIRLFGSADPLKEGDEADHQQGALRFFDALPAAWPRLERDVMTPHFSPYYQDPSKDAPALWHDPVPVGFLAVAPGQEFRFLIAARRGAYGALDGDLDRALGWLADALAWFGAGGKTSAGYGRFATDPWKALFG